MKKKYRSEFLKENSSGTLPKRPPNLYLQRLFSRYQKLKGLSSNKVDVEGGCPIRKGTVVLVKTKLIGYYNDFLLD